MKRRIYTSLVIFLLGFAFFYFFAFQVKGDVFLHASLLISGGYPANFIYYFLIDAFSFFHRDLNKVLVASAFILSISIVLKYHAALYLVSSLVKYSKQELSRNKKEFIALSSLILFSYPSVQYIVVGQYYFGQLPPNVWHNSTTIFLMPIAIVLFAQSFELLEKYSMKKMITVSLLTIISIYIKPSFFFILCPTYFLFFIIKKNKEWLKLTPIAIGCFALTILFFHTYVQEQGFLQSYEEDSKVVIMPFKVWASFLGQEKILIPLSLLTSITFPIANLLLNRRNQKFKRVYYYGTSMFTFGVLMYLFVGESGPRLHHANFIWQAIIGTYFLFMVNIIELELKKESKRYKLLSFIYGGHILSGLIYLMIIILAKSLA